MGGYGRHQMLRISGEGRERILRERLQSASDASEAPLLEELFRGSFSRGTAPAIVRRPDQACGAMVAVGFVHPRLKEGRRFRVASAVKSEEIAGLISPYGLPWQDYEERTPVMELLRRLSELPGTRARLGAIGSAAMEIVTGAPYTNDDSDLDLLLRDCSRGELSQIYESIRRLSGAFRLEADVEIELPNGYGIKAAEFFSNSGTLLGKSVEDVRLLERGTVMALLGVR
jgi:phosphoribosyl-dephospho-CoA transferase